jgi:chloride channel protein, CIC family
VGGVVLGGLLLVLPELYGVGYPVLGNAVAGGYAIAFLLVLMAGKIAATSLTIGIGGSGGVFAPSLFIGAMLGSAYGQSLHHLAPAVVGPAGAYGLIGMGAVFAGVARAPITAVIIMFELTGEYTIILPLMAAIVLATGISHLLTRDTIYTLKLRRRGIDLDTHPSSTRLATIIVGQVAEPIGATLHGGTTLLDALAVITRARYAQIPVLATDGSYVGLVTARGVADALADGEHDDATVASVIERPPSVYVGQTLDDILDALDSSGIAALPVLDAAGANLVGWLTHQQVLTALHARRPAPA